MKPLLQYPAADIQIDGIGVDTPLPADWLNKLLLDTEVRAVDGDGRLRGRLSRSQTDIVVRTRLRAMVSLPCARCLEPAEVTVDSELSLLLQQAAKEGRHRQSNRGAARKDDEYEFSPAEADVDTYDGETVVLDSFVREAILLEVPTFPLCRDSCPGIMPRDTPSYEGTTGPDPRLAPLEAFRDKPGPATIADLVEAAANRSTALTGRKPRLKANRAKPRKRKVKKR